MVLFKRQYIGILILLICCYVILPNYFRIFNQTSNLLIAIVIVLAGTVYIVKNHLTINRKTLRYSLLCCLFMSIVFIFHGETTNLIRLLIERLFLFVCVATIFKRDVYRDSLIKWLVYFALFEGITGLVHSFTGYNVFSLIDNSDGTNLSSSTQFRYGFPRAEGSFAHAITFGIYLSLNSILCLFLYNREKKKRYIFFYIVLIITCLLTLSRMPTICCAIGGILYLYKCGYKKLLKTLIKVILIISVSVLTIYIFAPKAKMILDTIFNLLSGVFSKGGLSGINSNIEGNAFSYRFEMLRVIPKMMNGNLILGIGYKAYSESFVFNLYGFNHTSIDNEYLFCLVRYGIVGLIGLIWQFLGLRVLCKKTLRIKQNSNNKILFYYNIIMIVYALNLLAVASLYEYRFVIVLMGVFFAEISEID